ncbi:Signal peptidase complex subunit spc2 [Neolecta irregularis DAH-3]|uniref:Signal peptidase complex subunit 2 n=1 Tax=Neolecta irregularis (strain DAH-3) TaxID=1198029 RepID=A0A1U7LVB7_NEOID|nr:Signal peptidase complex subunit spc2 [Neolecta irregularis DAH-3]|eukprot:OLL26492.1 Signal peptidase complex subunit spc2 [Neolecta irregularis DAH-3]
MSESRPNTSNLADLKNASDDAIAVYMNDKGYRQSNYLLDVRLALGYFAVLVAAATAGYDYLVGFQAAKFYTWIGAPSYFLLDGAMMLWTWLVEKKVVYVGEKDGKTIRISSHCGKFDPTYHLKLLVNPEHSRKTVEIKGVFPTWFTRDGIFVKEVFETWMDKAVKEVEKHTMAAKFSKKSE